ncbi:MAG: tautomerase family protein [Methyloceanibacter sp.]
MPFINVKLIEGVFNDAQKKKMVTDLIDAMVAIEGESMRGHLGGDRRGEERPLGARRQAADHGRCSRAANQSKRGLARAQSEAERPAEETAGPRPPVLRPMVGGTPNSRLKARVQAASES